MEHKQEHNHPIDNFGRSFLVGIILNTTFIIIEVVFGFLANSLALLADAGHNFSDVIGLLVAWGGIRLSQWQPTEKLTYGLRKSSILAALINALILLVSIGAILMEAIRRLKSPDMVQSQTMIWVASLGIAVNTISALMFVKGRQNDLNIRGAFLHMFADAVISAGVVLAGVMIWLTGIKLIDPMVGVIIAVAIFFSAWALLRESIRLTMDAVPENIDPKAVTDYFLGLPAVQDVHHLHVWGLSTTESALTAHLVLSKPSLDNGLLKRIQQELHDYYHIEHATIQFESHENNLCLTKRCSLHFDGGRKK